MCIYNVLDTFIVGCQITGYLRADNPYFGAAVGRVANRIGGGKFNLNGKTYQVAKNHNNTHHLHGGFLGIDKYNWNFCVNHHEKKVVFSLLLLDGDEGYPGDVIISTTACLNDDNHFELKFNAWSTKPTPVNLTNHSYFNLAGHVSAQPIYFPFTLITILVNNCRRVVVHIQGENLIFVCISHLQESGYQELYNHFIAVNADKITETDTDSIPSGCFISVENTPYDLRVAKKLGTAMSALDSIGYDDNFCIVRANNDEKLSLVGRASHPGSGRILEILSNQPGVQLYTSNYIADPKDSIHPAGTRKFSSPNKNAPIPGKNGALYTKHSAFCLETQNFPNAMNIPSFPNSILNPGETYEHVVIYKFLIEK